MRNRKIKRGWRLLVVLILGFNRFLFQPDPAWACKCTPTRSPASALDEADAVFAGTVVAVLDPVQLPYYDELVWRYFERFPATSYENFYSQLVILAVQDSWKGTDEAYIIIRTASKDTDCGYAFSRGEQYLVYGQDWQGDLWTGICTRTSMLPYATEDINYLKTLPVLPLTQIWLPAVIIGIGLALILFLLIASLIWLVRRNRLTRSRLQEI